MIRVSRVKLGRAPKQEAKLGYVLMLCRWLYNVALEQRIDAYERCSVSLDYYKQCKELTALRADDERYRQLPVDMTRLTSLRRLDLAFRGFFRRCESGETPGFPRYKGRDRFSTLTFGATGWYIDGRHLVLKAGPDPIALRMKNAIHREGKIKGLRIVKRGERWWADFLVEVGDAPVVKASARGVGIDVGIKTFATLSDGTAVEHPHFIQRADAKLREAQQAMSRCKKGSNRRARAKRLLATRHEKVRNQRRNFVFQTVAALVRDYDGFAVEKLDVREMVSSARQPEGMGKKATRTMRRNIMDSAWTTFMAHLASKAEEAGLPMVRVDPKGTTQRCSGCGSLVRKTLRERTHSCTACGIVLDRDLNAARNIATRGGLVSLDPGFGSASPEPEAGVQSHGSAGGGREGGAGA